MLDVVMQSAPELPAILYHYTSAEGLVGIFQSRELWATDAEFLNDAQELHFGRSELCARLENASALLSNNGYGTPGYNRGTVMKTAAHALRSGALAARRTDRAVYVTCFCEDGDLLSQWRGYAAGGYAIGFRTTALSAIDPRAIEAVVPETTAWPAAHLTKIDYGPAAIESMVSRALDDIAPEWVERMAKPGSRGAVHAETVATPALASIKHEAFAEEHEWRLVSVGLTQTGEIRFRSASLGVVPYQALQMPLDAIAQVVIGPGNDAVVRERGVRRLAQHHGLDIVVRHSEAPFRG